MARQKRPSGPLWTVDEAWKTAVKERMKELGIKPNQLAEMVDADPSSMTVLFRSRTKQSRLVPKIHKAFGMANTTAPVAGISRDDAFRRLERVWSKLSEAEREHLITTGEMLAAKH